MWETRSWDWFQDLLDYLLATDSAIGRAFRPHYPPTEDADV